MVNRGCTYLFSEVSKTFTFIWRVGDAPPSSAPLINASTIKSAVRSVGRRNRLLLIVSVKCCVFRSRVSSCACVRMCALGWRVRANLLAWEWGTWFSRASHSAGSPLTLVWGGLCFFRAIIYAVKFGRQDWGSACTLGRLSVLDWLWRCFYPDRLCMLKLGHIKLSESVFKQLARTVTLLCHSSPHNVVPFWTTGRSACACVREKNFQFLYSFFPAQILIIFNHKHMCVGYYPRQPNIRYIYESSIVFKPLHQQSITTRKTPRAAWSCWTELRSASYSSFNAYNRVWNIIAQC